MKTLSRKAKNFFKEYGRQGGYARSKKLSDSRRRTIAKLAADHRWKRLQRGQLMSFQSVRLNAPRLDSPVYMEEILSDGSWNDWREVYKCISEYPFGVEAQTLEKVLASQKIYGATELWRGILWTLRGRDV